MAIGLVVGPGSLLLIRVLFERLRGRPGLGLGDVKFAGAAALWVGANGLPLLFFVASIATFIKKRWCAPNRPENQANSDFLTFHDRS